MIYNMRRRKKKRSTWRFYRRPFYSESRTFNADFESSGRAWVGIQVNGNLTEGMVQMWCLTNNINPLFQRVSVYTITKGFENRDYETVTFDKPPSGELLAFLQETATPL